MQARCLSSHSRCTSRLAIHRPSAHSQVLDVHAKGLDFGLWRHAFQEHIDRHKEGTAWRFSQDSARPVAAFCATSTDVGTSPAASASGPIFDQPSLLDEHKEQTPTADAIFTSSCGTQWRIRPYDNRDYAAVVEVQTESFHITNPVPFLNQLIYTNFRAEVVDALRQKTKYSDPGRFQLLVAEESLLPGRPQPHTAAAAAATVVNTAIASSGVDDSGLSITRSSSSSSHSYHEDSSASSCSGAAQLVGSVEVSLMCEREVLRALPRNPLGEYVYISSMCVRSSQRRRGVAQVLMAAAEAQARRWGQPRLALHVFKDNAPAVELYRKCGMRVIGEDPAWKAMLGGKVRLLMYKELILEGQETGVEQR